MSDPRWNYVAELVHGESDYERMDALDALQARYEKMEWLLAAIAQGGDAFPSAIEFDPWDWSFSGETWMNEVRALLGLEIEPSN